VEARIPDCRSNVENVPRRWPVAGGPAAPASRMRRAVLGTPPSPAGRAGDARRPRPAGRLHYVVISWDGRKLVTKVRVTRYVAIATQPVPRLQIRPIVHN